MSTLDVRHSAPHEPAAMPERKAQQPVLFVMWQSGSKANGGITSIGEILRRLERVRPIIVTQRETDVTRHFRAAGFDVRLIAGDTSRSGKARRLRRMVVQLRRNLELYRILRDTGARVVHCNDIESLESSLLAARSLGARVVFNVRSVQEDDVPYGPFWHVAARSVDRLVVLSRDMADRLSRRFPWKCPIDAVYSIVDTTRMRPLPQDERDALRAQLGVPPNAFVVVYPASVGPRKGQLDLLRRGAAQLLGSVPNLHLYLVGDYAPDEPYGGECRDAALASGAGDRIHFVGYTPNVHHWLQVADVALVVSRREGLARAMIESLACGTPVVSFDVCSAREILEQHAVGYVVPHGDYAALCERIAELAKTPDLRSRMGGRAGELAPRLFSAGAGVRAYEDIYLSLAP